MCIILYEKAIFAIRLEAAFNSCVPTFTRRLKPLQIITKSSCILMGLSENVHS